MPEGISNDRENLPVVESRRLTMLYLFALSSVAILSIGGLLLVQWQLQAGKYDSHVINVAGRQRMLSQRLAKASLLRLDAKDDLTAKAELKTTLATWTKNHYGLQQGDVDLELPDTVSDEVASMFRLIEPHFKAMQAGANYLLQETVEPRKFKAATEAILNNESHFLEGMDRLVSQFVAEAEERVQSLRRLEYIILWLTLGVLIAEGLLIFRPAVRHIKRVNKGLNQAKEEAESANAAKTRFLANVSHELRTPMTAVLGMSELAKNSESEEELASYLETVQEAGNSLMSLLNDLIDIARIDANQLELIDEPFQPAEVIKRVRRMMQFAADAKSLRLVIENSKEELPNVIGDARRIEQVMLNFVANAIKSTDVGSVTIKVESIASDNELLNTRYSVIDTGKGIRARDQQKIFEPFSQIISENDQPLGGAGLGLAICRRITDAMGAKIELSSEIGKGTDISMLCQHRLANSEPKPAPAQEIIQIEKKLNVLVVEDTEVNQILLEKYFQQDGHQVKLVSEGESALQAYSEAVYDLVLIDLSLPRMNGEEVAKQIRAKDASKGKITPPIICITAHVAIDESQLEQHFDGVITKPFDSKKLFKVISSKLELEATSGSKETNLIDLDEELATAFLSIAESQLDELQQAYVAKDVSKIRLLSHRFRSQIGYFKASGLLTDLEALEDACLSSEEQKIEQLVPAVIESTRLLLKDLGNRLDCIET